MSEVSVPCASCAKPITFRDDACPSCRAAVPRDLRRALEVRLEASNLDYRDLKDNIRSASTVVLLVAVMQICWGAIRLLIEYAGDVVPSAGGHMAGAVEGASNITIGVLLFGCFVLCKRAPGIALVGALSIWLGVQAIVAMILPVMLLAGLLWKILGLVLLVRGVVAALKAASLMRRLKSGAA